MIIKSNIHKNEGLIRKMIKCGYGDLRVLVEDVEMKTLKSLLCCCNDTFREILEDKEFKEPLELYEGCNKDVFLMLERYYEGNDINVEDNNCVKLLLICVCYNENRLLNILKEYIMKRMYKNKRVIVELLNEKYILENKNLLEMKIEMNKYLSMKNYRLLNDKMMNEMNVNSIKEIFSNKVIFNGNRSELKELLNGYMLNNEKYLNEEENEMMKEIMNRINENEINQLIRYISIPKIKNEILYEYLIDNYPRENEEIEMKKEEMINNEIVKKNIIDLEMLLVEGNMIIKMMVMLLIYENDLCLIYEENKELLDELLNEYKLNDFMKRKKRNENILKCLFTFMRENESELYQILDVMVEKCGMEIVYDIIENDKILLKHAENINNIYYYIHNKGIEDRENELINEIIKDERKRIRIKNRKIKGFKYEGVIYLNIKGCLKPIVDGDVEEFYLKSKLPNGLSFNKETGEISGLVSKPYEGGLIVVAKNTWNAKEYKMRLEVYDKFHFTYDEHILLRTDKRTISYYTCEYGRRCLLNVKMEKSIYHFYFSSSCAFLDFYIGAVESANMYSNQHGKYCEIYLLHRNCYGNIGIMQKLNKIDLGDCSCEVIFDMKKKTFSIIDKYGNNNILFTNLPDELDPYVYIGRSWFNMNVTLTKWLIEE